MKNTENYKLIIYNIDYRYRTLKINMFKNIFEDILTVSFAQAPGWQKLDESFDKRQKNFLSDFMYPIMGITTIVKFLVVLISRGGLELAIKNACATFITLFVSFFLIIFILNELSKKFLLHDNNKRILLFTDRKSVV